MSNAILSLIPSRLGVFLEMVAVPKGDIIGAVGAIFDTNGSRIHRFLNDLKAILHGFLDLKIMDSNLVMEP